LRGPTPFFFQEGCSSLSRHCFSFLLAISYPFHPLQRFFFPQNYILTLFFFPQGPFSFLFYPVFLFSFFFPPMALFCVLFSHPFKLAPKTFPLTRFCRNVTAPRSCFLPFLVNFPLSVFWRGLVPQRTCSGLFFSPNVFLPPTRLSFSKRHPVFPPLAIFFFRVGVFAIRRSF